MSAEPKRHETAGGVVFNARGELLTLVRDIEREGAMRHEVRLPKGHLDPGESHEAAAWREVMEESGYGGVDIVADLGSYTSEYEFKGRHHVRDERYFLMRLSDETRRPPQPMSAEEALFEAQWLSPVEALAAMTYPSEQEFVRRAIEAMRTMTEGNGNDPAPV
ncbi:MAG: hypothetical protein RLZZ303_2766 [Candidatus Hydrogenedentota bacterium]